MPKKLQHQTRVLTYGELHLHVMEAIDAIRARWPEDTDARLLHRLVVTAQRIMDNRRNGVAVVMRRTDIID